MHVNFTNGEVNQIRAEAIPMHQQRTHLRPTKVFQGTEKNGLLLCVEDTADEQQ